ncbi:MAG: prolipoprotein diacylglyceryl transferase [Bifidobacteriaceae bacterium]|jgi:prolipoprotein diacylglyceryl transferase|nr:prolipoprotein diacylglyceryl transferase [Bifidobacteriaceae bacterium]
MNPLALLPSPPSGVWHLGPLPIRAYALTMLAGMVVAALVAARRLKTAGYKPDVMWDISLWAIPFGIVGARIYHVITSPDAYFGVGGEPWRVFAIWEGGLGVWGAIALGAVGGMIGARRTGIPVPILADALAPGLALAQAVGRLGNWFNQELFGAPTTLPWGLQVEDKLTLAAGYPVGTLFHPTFLYELLWDAGLAVVLIWAGRRFRWAHGQVFFAYMGLYCLGRVWIEALRIDTAHHFLGLRLNVWTSILVGLTGLGLFCWSRWKHRADPDTQADAEAGTEAEAEGEAEGEAALETDLETDSEADSEAELEVETGTGVEPEPELTAEAEAGEETATESTAEATKEAESEEDPPSEPGSGPDTR